MATLNIKNFPDDLYARLREHAERARRSVAQHVTHLLEQTLSSPEPVSLLELEGLGQEVWSGTDAARHVRQLRDGWRDSADPRARKG